MDKYEFKIKAEQIERLVERKDYATAGKIADGIDWRRVKNVELLMIVSEIYENLERYEDSYEILNIAYDRAPIGRMIVYRMTEIATKMGDFDEAAELYKEFVKIAPHDLSRYILKYKIYQAKGAPLSDQIAILEEYKGREYHEKWAYALAVLYYKEGMTDKCVEECDDLILWFSEGEYVRRALELKQRIQPLTASQEEKYQILVQQMEAENKEQEPEEVQEVELDEAAEEQEPEKESDKQEDIFVRTVNPEERYSTINLQQELAVGIQDVLKEEAESEEPEFKEAADQLQKEPEEPEKKTLSVFPQAEKLRLGQSADGQLTFDAKESVVDYQITGQMTLEEILAEWEVKKQEMEAKIALAAEEERERRAAERSQLQQEQEQEDGKEKRFLGTPSLIPPDVQQLIDEIERRIPVRVFVEPIERDHPGFLRSEAETPEELELVAAEETAVPEEQEESSAEKISEDSPEEKVSEEPSEKKVSEGPPEEKASEGPSEEKTLEEPEFPAIEEEIEDDLPEEIDEIEALLTAALEEELSGDTQTKEMDEAPLKVSKSEQAEDEVQSEEKAGLVETEEEKAEPASNMMWDLEKMLEEELKNVSGDQLSEEQKKLFAYFTSVHGMNQQLAQFLEEEKERELDGTSITGNLVVTGESGTGKTTLAIDLVKALQKQRKIKGSKMAKVTGEALSQKNIQAVVRKLNGGALVVEQAGGLTIDAATQLSVAMLGQTGNMFVILEDEPAEIQKLFTRCESLAAKFEKKIMIPVFNNNELVTFAKSYALEQNYVMDEMAVLALYNRIGNNQTSDHLVNVTEVKEMIDDAIENSRKKGLKKLFSKRRRDEFGNNILLEKDFEE